MTGILPVKNLRGIAPAIPLFVCVALAPLPFGSTDPSVIACWAIVLGVGACATVGTPRARIGNDLLLLYLSLLVAVIGGYLFVLHEQLSSSPWFASADPIWDQASTALGIRIPAQTIVANHAPYFALGRPIVYLLALLTGFFVGTDDDLAKLLLKVFAWSGVFYAVYGIFSHLVDPNRLLWRPKEAYTAFVTGTFINRNTAAIYFGAAAGVWVLFVLRDFARRAKRRSRAKQSLLDRLAKAPRQTLLHVFFVALCLVAVLMTGSRGGFLLTVFALGLAFFVRTKLAFANRQIAIVAAVSTIVLGLAALQLFGGTLNARFDTKGLGDVDRLDVYSDTLRLIADHPWLGSGLGTFPFVFPAYRDDQSNLWGTIDRAHDTPLELAAELGIPLTVVIATAWIAILWVLLRNARTQDTKGLVSAAAACLAILGLSHSLIDFSMQIAGFGIPVFAIVGAGLAQAARLPESDEAALAEEPEQDILQADSAG